VARFDGGRLSSDGGLLWLKALDEELGVCALPAGSVREWREARRIKQTIVEMARQRVFGICCGYEDGNDDLGDFDWCRVIIYRRPVKRIRR